MLCLFFNLNHISCKDQIIQKNYDKITFYIEKNYYFKNLSRMENNKYKYVFLILPILQNSN